MKNKEIKLFSIRNALSKQIPLKVNGFAETRNFPHFSRKVPQRTQGNYQDMEFPTPAKLCRNKSH